MNWWQNLIEKLTLDFDITALNLTVVYKTVITLVAAVIGWLILKRILSSIEKRSQKYEFLQQNTRIFIIIRKALFYALVLCTGSYLLNLFNIYWLGKIFYAFIIVLLASPASDFMRLVLNYLAKFLADKEDTKIDDIVFDLLKKFCGAIIYSIAIILALDILGVNVMPFIAGAGIAGIAIGFAAKDTLSNLIAGVLLIIDRPFEVGDRIEVWSAPVGSATWGDVIDIGLRATKIKTTDNIVIIIPNNEIMRRDIVNYTIITSKIRVRVGIGISYDANIKRAKEIILTVADSTEWIAKDPPPKVVVRNFGESSVDLQLRIWIDDARQRMDTISHITDKVKEAFDEEGIEIPYPKRDVHIKYEYPIEPGKRIESSK
jgi:small-conductance mechanosensitive channel